MVLKLNEETDIVSRKVEKLEQAYREYGRNSKLNAKMQHMMAIQIPKEAPN